MTKSCKFQQVTFEYESILVELKDKLSVHRDSPRNPTASAQGGIGALVSGVSNPRN